MISFAELGEACFLYAAIRETCPRSSYTEREMRLWLGRHLVERARVARSLLAQRYSS